MKIHSMTATFGKLDNETLTLQPGLNVIHAPNEWGKSTWCAFLCAMLYGIDTRQRSGKDTIPDKRRYEPWSGNPMSGRIDLSWKGRNITIERSTQGRVIFGAFRAYETDTGLPVTQLTGENCGLVLLGVEKNVFTRTGFIRFGDLPVTEDDALRRRLNALVTTGDERDTGDALAKKLKDLKNACRHNKTGLLPQAYEKQAALRQDLQHLELLQTRQTELLLQQENTRKQVRLLKNHLTALDYRDARAHLQQLEQTQNALEEAARKLASQETLCQGLPSPEEARQKLSALHGFRQEWEALQTRELTLPLQPEAPRQEAPFYAMDPQQAEAMVQRDLARYQKLTNKKKYLFTGALCLLGLAGSLILPQQLKWLSFLAAIPLILQLILCAGDRAGAKTLEDTYGSKDPQKWEEALRRHKNAQGDHRTAMEDYRRERESLAGAKAALLEARKELTQGEDISFAISRWEQSLAHWQELDTLREHHARLSETLKALQAAPVNITPPEAEDPFTFTRSETLEKLHAQEEQLRQMQLRLGQLQGQQESLGDPEANRRELELLEQRIQKLEETYEALVIAQQTLTEAAKDLQRQFAPRITARARELFRKLTGGRYDRLALGEDFSLSAATGDETSLLSGLWRSDGTVDQLYLSLRLAAAGELTPSAPLILDDALVRFDEQRLARAMEVLLEEASFRQVLVFTCQKREQEILDRL